LRRFILFVLVGLIGIVLVGCSFGQSPETVTKEFLTSLQTCDFDKAATYTETSDKDISKDIIKNDEGERIGKLILSKATYEVGTSSTTGEKLTVKVKVTAIDMVRIATKVMSELMPMAFASAFSDDKNASNEQMDSLMNQYLENSISDAQAPKVANEVNVNLIASCL